MRHHRIRVSGKRACFTNSAFTGERFSYPVPTPVALEGVLKAIHWQPGIRWNIHRISVLNPIVWSNLFRNEVQKFGEIDGAQSCFTQRMTTLLRNPDYIVEVSVGREIRECPNSEVMKCDAMFERYMNQGKQFSQPFLGCREFTCDVRWAEESDPKPIAESRALGRMVYGYLWEGDRRSTILEYEPVMKNGVIEVPSFDSVLAAHNRASEKVSA
jgi:CRISPR-associated protein Cas5d